VETCGGFSLFAQRNKNVTKIAILIDGGYLREVAKKQTYYYDEEFIEKMIFSIPQPDEQLFRVLYYDCNRYQGKVILPVSRKPHEYKANDWLSRLATKNFVAVRQGVLKFRGFKLTKMPAPNTSLSDDDFSPIFEQKGVDMRLGIDIANFSISKSVGRIILISGDTDCVPAMKYGRISGLQIVIIRLPNQTLSPELLRHADECRDVQWPTNAKKKFQNPKTPTS